ncbi:hypothetical protein WOLCODRAFT_60045, partial [Wolfiporia cocos MD-104 SS10]
GVLTHVEVHKMPNAGFCKVGHRQQMRLFFPRLYKSHEVNLVDSELLVTLYNRCVRPAILAIVLESGAHWPVNYAAAYTQCQGRNGQLHFTSQDIPWEYLKAFTIKMMGEMNWIPEFRDAFFMHEVRGIKNTSQHAIDDPVQAMIVLDEQLEIIDVGHIDQWDWFVNVSIEVSEGGRVLQWTRYVHEHLLRFALPQVPERRLGGHMGGKHFWCSQVSQLTEFVGFRSEPLRLGREDGVLYINCYTTDKSTTYQMHSGVFHRHGPSDLFLEKIAVLLSNMEKMSQTFMACQGDPRRNMEPQGGTVQFELRVPL